MDSVSPRRGGTTVQVSINVLGALCVCGSILNPFNGCRSAGQTLSAALTTPGLVLAHNNPVCRRGGKRVIPRMSVRGGGGNETENGRFHVNVEYRRVVRVRILHSYVRRFGIRLMAFTRRQSIV